MQITGLNKIMVNGTFALILPKNIFIKFLYQNQVAREQKIDNKKYNQMFAIN